MRLRPLPRATAALLVAALVGPLAGARAQPAPAARRAVPARAALVRTLDSLVRASMAEEPVAGLSVAVVRGRDTLLMRGYGFADLEQQAPADPATVYRIGSLTKQFTAAAVMRLVEQGMVSLDDDITKYVPGAPVQGRHVLVRHLLNHTSGLRSYTNLGERWVALWGTDLTPDSLLGLTRHDSLEFEPGARWNYENTGYILLGMLLEKVGGKPYADYVQETLFAPLGLKDTRYCGTAPIIPRRADGYEPAGKGFRHAAYLSMTHPYAAGALCSTVRDLVAWQAALAGGKVVRPASYARMTTPETLTSTGKPIEIGYGYGLRVDSLQGHRRVSHSGGINGFVSELHALPDDSLVVVVLTNTAPSNPGRLARNLSRAVLGLAPYDAAPVRPTDKVATTAAQRDAVSGEYELTLPTGAKLPLRVYVEDGLLYLQPQGQRVTRLYHQGADTFLTGVGGIRIVFAMEGGRAAKLTMYQGGATMEAPRVR